MKFLKYSTAATIKLGPFLSGVDGVTEATGLSITQSDVRLSKNGGNIAQKNDSSSCTHDELGYYDLSLDTTDTNTLGNLKIITSMSGIIPVWDDFSVITNEAYNLLTSGDNTNISTISDRVTTALPNVAPGSSNGLFIAGTNAPVIISGAGDALQIRSTSAGRGVYIVGNGASDGLQIVGGTTSGKAVNLQSVNNHALECVSSSSAYPAVRFAGSASAGGFDVDYGSTSVNIVSYLELISGVVDTSLPNIAPGEAGGLFVAGTNAATTISGNGYGLKIISTGTTSNAVDIYSPWQGVFIDANLGAMHLYSPGGYALRANGGGGDFYLENSTTNVGPILESISNDITLTSGDLSTSLPGIAPGQAGGLFIAGENAATTIRGDKYALRIIATGGGASSTSLLISGAINGANIEGGATAAYFDGGLYGIRADSSLGYGFYINGSSDDLYLGANSLSVGGRLGTALPNAAPGSANGLLRAGINAPVTISGAGHALRLQSTSEGNGVYIVGNGTSDGARIVGGLSNGKGLAVSSVNNHAAEFLSASSSSAAVRFAGTANAGGFDITDGGTTLSVLPVLSYTSGEVDLISSNLILTSGGLNTTILATSGGGACDLTTIDAYITDLSGTTYTILTGVLDLQSDLIRKGTSYNWTTVYGTLSTTIG